MNFPSLPDDAYDDVTAYDSIFEDGEDAYGMYLDSNDNSILIDGAEIEQFFTYAGDDHIVMSDGYITELNAGDDNDLVILQDDADFNEITLGKGDDTLNVEDGVDGNYIFGGDGTDLMNVSVDSVDDFSIASLSNNSGGNYDTAFRLTIGDEAFNVFDFESVDILVDDAIELSLVLGDDYLALNFGSEAEASAFDYDSINDNILVYVDGEINEELCVVHEDEDAWRDPRNYRDLIEDFFDDSGVIEWGFA